MVDTLAPLLRQLLRAEVTLERAPAAGAWPVLADRRPIVPLTMEVSMLRELLEAQFPGSLVIRFDHIEAYKWLVISEPVDIRIVLTAQSASVVQVEIDGYMRATALLGERYPARPLPSSEPLIAPAPSSVSAQQLYAEKWMFHGPAYQGVSAIGQVGRNGISGHLIASAGPGALLDNMGQLAGFWVMETATVNPLAMPIGVDSIAFYGPEPGIGERFACQVRIRQCDLAHCKSDIELIDGAGQVLVAMTGWTTRRYTMDRALWMRIKDIALHPVCSEIAPGVMLFEDHYDTAIMRDFIARRYLNQPELAHYEQRSPRGKRAWLNGRVAAKDAVRASLWRDGAERQIYPKELLISNDELGAPQVSSHVTNQVPAGINLSIAHKDLLAVALASARPVGVDVELIAMPSAVLLETALSESERARLPALDRDEWFTRFWVAKEARSKVDGSGLMGSPKRFVVEAIDGERLRVNGIWVETRRHDSVIIGWSIDDE